MKRIPMILAILMFAGCSLEYIEPIRYTVVDSAWNVVKTGFVDAPASRSLESTMSVLNSVDSYNEATNEDQYFYFEGEPPPIEEAPPATAIIVRDDTLAVMYEATVERLDLVERREAWILTTQTIADPVTLINIPCTLFVDKIPELPPAVEVDPYARYAVYLLDGTGAILYEEHTTPEAFSSRVSAYNVNAELMNRDFPDDGPYTVVSGQLYIPPTAEGD
jgi:hypothetical protein